MSPNAQTDRFIEALISGQRDLARKIVDACVIAQMKPEQIIEKLFWPALETIEQVARKDQMAKISHHYATRMLRMFVDQMQAKLSQRESNGLRTLVICGPDEPNELAGQMTADLLEARGHEIFFPGGGVANDEIIKQLALQDINKLVIFSSVPSDLPDVRQLIDEINEMGLSDQVQIIVGGGVFNRAEGLAQEIGADLWAVTPFELVDAIELSPERRADDEQRTVGRGLQERKRVG